MTAALTASASPANAEAISLRSKREPKNDSRVPHPSHRHAAPSAPWPWVDLEDEVDRTQLENSAPPIPAFCSHDASCNNCWDKYPQSRFPNWTYKQVVKSKIQRAITSYDTSQPCILHRVDIDSNGLFTNVEPITAEVGNENEVWQQLVHEQRPPDLRVRALFIQNMSGPILQMLGTKYNIEPFFWSSSLNWIPSRFQEEIKPGVGDHITITLTFLKSMLNLDAIKLDAGLLNKSTDSVNAPSTLLGSQKIDTQAPLVLYSSPNPRVLLLDLLSVHLIRNKHGSTIISYHPSMALPTMTAPFFHSRIRFAGQSVYWQNIFQKSPDPTFIFLTFLWHALYAWDEALENLYDHICYMETRVLHTTNIKLTHELHSIRAHHLHYTSLLEDYQKHVKFIHDTKNPMLDSFSHEDKKFSREILERECNNLSAEIKRLKDQLYMQERRLKNVMGLVFSSVNIQDSRYMRDMTAAAVRDSTAMKQIAYLTMAFLPASFVAGVFGMNVNEINPGTNGTLGKYFATALPLTILTAWVVTAFQSEAIFPNGANALKRMLWPVFLLVKFVKDKRSSKTDEPSVFSISAVDEDGNGFAIQ